MPPNLTKLAIVSVDYALAPEYPWPYALNQVIKVYKALLAKGYKADQIAFFGDSAGGGLAVSSVLKIQALGLAMPKALVLWSPWLDLSASGDSYHSLANAELMFTYPKQLRKSALAYAPESMWHNPYISPVYALVSSKFPATLIQVGSKELLLSDSIRFYQILDTSGIAVKLDVYDGMWHDFQVAVQIDEAKLAQKKLATFVKQQLQD